MNDYKINNNCKNNNQNIKKSTQGTTTTTSITTKNKEGTRTMPLTKHTILNRKKKR